MQLRERLPATNGRVFLNYAATAPMLQDAADAMTRVARENLEPLSEHFEEWLRGIETARRDVARLVNASAEEIAFTSSTSMALSLVAASVPWKRGDRVLYPADEFPSNRFVWQNLASRGVIAEALPADGTPLHEQLAATDLSGVCLVAFSHVSYHDGRRADVRSVTRHCRERGILTSVDGIQAAGAIPVDLADAHADFYACGGQKWLLGPVGSGFLYVRSRTLDALQPPIAGWASSRAAPDAEVERYDPCDGARRLEPGLPDVASIAGLAASVRALEGASPSKVHARVAAHERRLREGLLAEGRRVLAPEDERAGIVTLEFATDGEARTLADACKGANVLVTHRGRTVRASAHATTSDEEVDAFLRLAGGRSDDAAREARTRESRPPVRSYEGAYDQAGRPRRALVTGATRGLGRAIATRLAARGDEVILLARDEKELARTAAAMQGASWLALDLSDADAVAAFVRAHEAKLASLDVLVNAAAIADAALFAQQPLARARAAMEANALAPMALVQAALPGMLARKRGAVLNVVTSGARSSFPLFSSYSASKGALWAWSESLGRELAGTGVAVTSFLPPHMETATRRHLGRAALAHYDVPRESRGVADPDAVAARAIVAMDEGRAFDAPWGARWQIAINAVAPGVITRRVLKSWKG